MKKYILLTALAAMFVLPVFAQVPANPVYPVKDSVITQPETVSEPKPAAEVKKKNWYDVISIRGYAQFRYNRFLETNSMLKCDQCDKSIGDAGGFFFRRARLVFSGWVHERVFMYIQADVTTNATAGSTLGLNYLQIRDFYGDVYLNPVKTIRARIGVSKVPFGFDNMQSSQNRLAFDRSDAINSSTYNERDMGIFLYYTPKRIHDRFKHLVDSGLKGTGDYGMIGGGVYNGQTANRNELNNSPHAVLRAAYPFLIGEKQILELGIQGYSGWFNVGEAKLPGVSVAGNTRGNNFLDQRVAASFILFPQPFGIQAEYMYGQGPVYQYNYGFSPDEIVMGRNEGGYVQVMYMKKYNNMLFTPYARAQYFFGGKKVETDARRHIVKELELGIEWQIIKQLEFTVAYSIADRVFEDSRNPVYHQKGNFMRFQLQFNY